MQCGRTTIDGYAFCSGLSALSLSCKTTLDPQGTFLPIA
jgi:hypothetical protein